jgi:NAD(P)-dependent dehydrogenase (short-subunit alcohol dehydrogenase family)
MMTSLADKTALITGASRGMGRATALALAAAGARVIVHFGRNADEAESARLADAPMRFPPISPRLMAPTRLPRRSVT